MYFTLLTKSLLQTSHIVKQIHVAGALTTGVFVHLGQVPEHITIIVKENSAVAAGMNIVDSLVVVVMILRSMGF